ncbi:hypothetical protein L3Q82_005936 [Scortum barcoo]|uniref:Uncharacterized protein n=1 Tax=Scortum barcoo TaxID=214431 RepID=A0ACB8X241_9TELE|nr:hypothetical protein L3Q82_005936 [Scortum barcoo]
MSLLSPTPPDPSTVASGIVTVAQFLNTADMTPLFISLLLAAMCLECRAQKDNVLQPKGDVTVTEGEEVTLPCEYNTTSTGPNLYWYKQDGNNSPKFILSRFKGDKENTGERFSFTPNSTLRSVPLKIQKLQLSDSAVYYCALQPTVTGNSKTLYKNLWSKDNRILHNGIQAITDHKPSNSTPTVMNVSFLNELNDFYARFDKDNKEKTIKPKPFDVHQTLTLSPTDVQNALSQINARKAAGPDGILGRVLRACAEKLAGVFTDIFNLSLAQTAVPACFKTTLIVPVPKTLLSDVPE